MRTIAPAKVNLYLDVLGRRDDGYHELVTLMCCIGLHDTLELTPARRISVACNAPGVPEDESNLAYRAASCFFEAMGIDSGVHITIDKAIPIGAGLGGGSSDAAAVLKALNRHFNFALSEDRLSALALTLGADVPFFIYGRPALATGIGETLTPFAHLRPHPLVVVYPATPVSTAAVYKKLNLGLTKTEKINTKIIFEPGWYLDMPRQLFNALEPAAFALCSEIETAKIRMLESGAAGALMSGSGSAVFGVFKDAAGANIAYQKLSKHSKWQVFQTQLLV